MGEGAKEGVQLPLSCPISCPQRMVLSQGHSPFLIHPLVHPHLPHLALWTQVMMMTTSNILGHYLCLAQLVLHVNCLPFHCHWWSCPSHLWTVQLIDRVYLGRWSASNIWLVHHPAKQGLVPTLSFSISRSIHHGNSPPILGPLCYMHANVIAATSMSMVYASHAKHYYWT